MFFRKKSFQAKTTYVVLTTLVWFTLGGHAWAEQTAAEANPRAFLLRLAEDPRLSLTPEQRETLRGAAQRPDAAELLTRLADHPRAHLTPEQRELLLRLVSGPSCAPTTRPVSVKSGPARAMAGLASELRLRMDDAASSAKARLDARAIALDALERFEAAHAEVLAEFAATERALRRANLPAKVLDRHATVVAEYREQAAAVRAQLEAAQEGDLNALTAAATALTGSTDERAHRPYDPTHLPYAVVEPNWREPGQSPPGPEVEAKATAGPPVRSTTELPPYPAVPALSHAPPTANDLEETIDVRITPEIRALAASLDDEPLRIYDWVHDNVEFYPTWGSVQGSQRTLDMGRGNAFDVSSLLIALLRAAGVPARYVTGTVEIPAPEVQNWLGGAATSEVAQQILGQGGIANVGLVVLGMPTAIRMEHVWVEAWIDNVPSRGAVNREGDTWLPLDAAFKQHVFTPASDVFTAVPFDPVFDPTNPPFTVDESLGKITDVDTDPLDEALAQWVQDADDHVLLSGVERSREGVLGGQEIVPVTSTVFAGALPYRVIERDGALSELPPTLRHTARLRGFRSQSDRALSNATFDVSLSLPELDVRRLSLRFPPATQADADVLDAARENGATSLPVYLVDVAPVVELDGVEVARGDALGMGSHFFLDVVLQEPGRTTTTPYQVIAGDEVAVGVTGNGVNEKVVEKRFNAFPVDNAPEYLHQVQLHYWAETDYLGELAASRRGVHTLRLPSVSLVSSTLSVSYYFGAPRTAVYAGRVMDVQRSLIGAAGADQEQVVAWVKQSGLQGSYLEGSVFEQLELAASGTPQPNGISAVHLIVAAASLDVPIYRITPENASTVQPLLNLPADVERDIANALAAGQSVLTPESVIDLGPWSGVGYILQDEETGDGAYLISGGLAGGGVIDCLIDLLPKYRDLLTFILLSLLLARLLWLLIPAPVLVPAVATAVVVFLLFLILWRAMGTTTAPPLPA